MLLSNATNAKIADGTGIGTIVNDDPLPKITISDASIKEGNSGTTKLKFSLHMDKARGLPVTVNYKTVDGTAKAGSDYVASSGTITFAPGEKSMTITILIDGDKTKEKNETLLVELFGAVNGTIAKSSATGTIMNND